MEYNNKDGKYGKIIKGIENNGNLTSQAKNDIIKDVASFMRVDMFDDSSSVDAVFLKKIILETDNAITQAYRTFKKETNIGICNHLTNLCLSQRKNLGKYKEMVDLPIQIENNIDNLLEQCQKFKSRKNEYDGKLQSISEQIKFILDKEFKTRRMSDYKQLHSLATEGMKITKEAEQKHINIVHLKGMSIVALEKHIELANKQIQWFDNLNSQNETKIRALNQEIINALSSNNKRDVEDSLNIIRLCRNMREQIEFLTTKGAKIPKVKYADVSNIDKCIEIEQKKIEEYKERKRKLETDHQRRMQECVDRATSYDGEIAQYADSSNCRELSFEDCQRVIAIARKLKRDIEYLKENNYKIPRLTWFNPDALIQKMEHRIEKIKGMQSEAISDIKGRDQTISGIIHRDYRVLSVDDCRQIIGICKEQKRTIDYYERKGIRVSGLNNGNIDYLIYKFEDICQNKMNFEKEKKERERQQREREWQQQKREQERERQQRERERQQRERELERERQQRKREQDRERQQRERERQQREANETREIYEKLKRCMNERSRIQERQDKHWETAKKGISQHEELSIDVGEIGRVNHEINKLIGRLMRYPNQHSSYKLAIDFLEHEIDRCKHIRNKFDSHINKVARGMGRWTDSDGRIHQNNAQPIKYVAQLDNKINRYQVQLEKLREMSRF